MSVTVNSSNTNEEINKILKSEKKELKFRKVGLENYKLLLQQKNNFKNQISDQMPGYFISKYSDFNKINKDVD